MRGAVDDFHLRRNYQEMTALLHSKNAELATVNRNLEERVADRTRDLLEALVTALDQRGAEVVHSRRVAAWCVRLGAQLQLSPEEMATLQQGALIHDVGKIGIPDSILLKGAALNPEEWEQMRRHPENGYRMLANIPFLGEARKLVLTHHERWDGSGYPLGLAGAAIPRSARILQVCEAYESMALAKMREIGIQLHEKYRIHRVAMVHRLGRLEIGETSVFIAVSAPHRAAAFDACRFAIDTLKRTVPIWKKEYFADGGVWADGELPPTPAATTRAKPAS